VTTIDPDAVIQQADDYVAIFEPRVALIYRGSTRELTNTLYTGANPTECLLAMLGGRPVVVALSRQAIWARDALTGDYLWLAAPSARDVFPCGPTALQWGVSPVIGYTLVGKWESSGERRDLATGRASRATSSGFQGAWDAAGWYSVVRGGRAVICSDDGRTIARLAAPPDAPSATDQVVVDGRPFRLATTALAFGGEARTHFGPTEVLVVGGPQVACIDREGATRWTASVPAGSTVRAAAWTVDGWRVLVAHGDATTVHRVGAAGEFVRLREARDAVAFVGAAILRSDFSVVGIDDGAVLGAFPEPALAELQTCARFDTAGALIPFGRGNRAQGAANILAERAARPSDPTHPPTLAGLDLEALVASSRGRWKPADETLPSGLRVVASSFVESDWKEGQGIREQYVVEARTTRLGILRDAPAAVVHVTYERNVGAAYAELIGPLRPSEVASWVAAAAAVR